MQLKPKASDQTPSTPRFFGFRYTKPNASSACSACSAFERKQLPTGSKCLLEGGVFEVVCFGDRALALGVNTLNGHCTYKAVALDGLDHARIGELEAVPDGGVGEREGAGLRHRAGHVGHAVVDHAMHRVG